MKPGSMVVREATHLFGIDCAFWGSGTGVDWGWGYVVQRRQGRGVDCWRGIGERAEHRPTNEEEADKVKFLR
jgi:hypothetical protein